jgi:hypothetical protein
MKLVNDEGLIHLQWGDSLRESVYLCEAGEVVGLRTSGRTLTIDLPHSVSTSVRLASPAVAERALDWLAAHSLTYKELDLSGPHEDASQSLPGSSERQGSGES